MRLYHTTRKQREAIHGLWKTNPNGSASYREFRKRFKFALFGDYVGGMWAGMYVGIEPDGYTHT